jgi:hypothetical protein
LVLLLVVPGDVSDLAVFLACFIGSSRDWSSSVVSSLPREKNKKRKKRMPKDDKPIT